jgi:hypothetical protein
VKFLRLFSLIYFYMVNKVQPPRGFSKNSRAFYLFLMMSMNPFKEGSFHVPTPIR